MIVRIEDDFDLDKITSCGQCFRAEKITTNTFRFITGKNVLYISALGNANYRVSCDENIWQNVWFPYFSLETNYQAMRESAVGKDCFVDQAIEHGRGLRILRQDPWEMLITFIISQRKSIPAISKAVNALANKFGEHIITPIETLYAFPTPSDMETITLKDLEECSLGYRSAYVLDAIQKVTSGEISLARVSDLDDEGLFQTLLQIRGVGKKVANCVCLFGYGRTSMVPVDVWIQRAINEDCKGTNPFFHFGKDAGIIQQYIFYYKKGHQLHS